MKIKHFQSHKQILKSGSFVVVSCQINLTANIRQILTNTVQSNNKSSFFEKYDNEHILLSNNILVFNLSPVFIIFLRAAFFTIRATTQPEISLHVHQRRALLFFGRKCFLRLLTHLVWIRSEIILIIKALGIPNYTADGPILVQD